MKDKNCSTGMIRSIAAAGILLTTFANSPQAYSADLIQLPTPPNTSPPAGFVTGVGGSLGPVYLSGQLVQGFGFTDNLQQDATEVRGTEYMPSVSLTGGVTEAGATFGLTGTYSGNYPIDSELPIGNDAETLSGSAILPLTSSTSLNGNVSYSNTFVETFTPEQFLGGFRDDILNYSASAGLSHQTQRAFYTATLEHDEFITALTAIEGPIRTESNMDRKEDRIAAQGGIIGQNGHRLYLSFEANRFDYEAAALKPRDAIALKLGAGLNAMFGDFTFHADVLGLHKSFRRHLPDVIDVEAAFSLQWNPRETSTLMAVFARAFEETNMIESTGIQANQLYLSWRERPTEKLYVQGTFMYSVFNVRELDDVTDGWAIYLDAGYAFNPHVYAKIAAIHAHQRTDAAGIDFSATRIEVTTHFIF